MRSWWVNLFLWVRLLILIYVWCWFVLSLIIMKVVLNWLCWFLCWLRWCWLNDWLCWIVLWFVRMIWIMFLLIRLIVSFVLFELSWGFSLMVSVLFLKVLSWVIGLLLKVFFIWIISVIMLRLSDDWVVDMYGVVVVFYCCCFFGCGFDFWFVCNVFVVGWCFFWCY